jgi:hypothetical protein
MIIERRTVLQLPLAAAGLLAAGIPLAAAARGEKEAIGFDELAATMGAMARELRAQPKRNEEAYLARVTALVARLARVPDAAFGPLFKDAVASALSYRGSWIVLVQWRMEPNRVYPAHNHPNYNQVTLGIEGECRIRNYQVVGDVPPFDSPKKFSVRMTQDNFLLPGGTTSIFSTTRDNIHELETGPQPARGMDLMTLVGEHQGFSFVNIDRNPTDARRREHPATWGEHLAR